MMYQIVAATPLGELISKPFDKEEKVNFEQTLFSCIGSLNSISFVVEDGATVYLTKEMMGRSVFFIKEV